MNSEDKFHIQLLYHDDTNVRKSLVNQNTPLVMECTADLPNPINIAYQDMLSVKRFLLSWEGKYLVRLATEGEYKLEFFPSDVYSDFTSGGKEIYDEFYDILAETPNITMRNTEWYGDRSNYHPGTQIALSIKQFVNRLRDVDFDSIDKKYHFLTLNNIGKEERIELYDFFQKNPKVDKQSLSSFLWMGKALDGVQNQTNSNTGQKNRNHLYDYKTLKKFYSECAIEIVVESGPNMLTEKLLKPLLMGTPFLLHSNNMANLYPAFNNFFGIDFNYFGVNYDKVFTKKPTNIQQVQKKILEISQTPLLELKSKYKADFEKAKQNRIKILKVWDTFVEAMPGFKVHKSIPIENLI